MKPATTRRLTLSACGIALAMLAAYQAGIDPAGLGASPASKSRFEVVVTLRSQDLRTPFEYRIGLTRSEYQKAKFSPEKLRRKAIDGARKALAKKLGLVGDAYGSSQGKISNAKIENILLIDHRGSRDRPISILRDASIS